MLDNLILKKQTCEIEREENLRQWDDYNCEILPKVGTSYPDLRYGASSRGVGTGNDR